MKKKTRFTLEIRVHNMQNLATGVGGGVGGGAEESLKGVGIHISISF